MRRLSAVAVATALTAAAVGGGLLVTAPAPRTSEAAAQLPPPTPQGTPLAELDTRALVVVRAPFCDRIPDGAVLRALGDEPADVASYESGERAPVTDEVRDVVHEFSCAYSGADGAEARGWVFAPPVSRAAAKTLAAQTGDLPGCRELTDAPAYGKPSVASLCRDDAGLSVAFRGLFGDAWVSCTLEVPGATDESELADRAGRWCAAVATATAAEV